MKRWMGLFKKEWALMKWFLVAFVLTTLGIVIIEMSGDFYGELTDTTHASFIKGGMWFLLHTYMGVLMLLGSLSREKKRLDIWLHSPAPLMQLVGVKVLFSVLAIMCSLLLSGIVIAASYYASEAASISGVTFWILGMSIAIILNSIYAMAFAFFFWCVYQVLSSRIGRSSTPVTLALAIIIGYFWALIWFTDEFQAIKEMGPFLGLSTMPNGFIKFFETNYILAGMMPENAILSVGSLLLYGFVPSVLFICGAVFFEKKVRY